MVERQHQTVAKIGKVGIAACGSWKEGAYWRVRLRLEGRREIASQSGAFGRLLLFLMS